MRTARGDIPSEKPTLGQPPTLFTLEATRNSDKSLRDKWFQDAAQVETISQKMTRKPVGTANATSRSRCRNPMGCIKYLTLSIKHACLQPPAAHMIRLVNARKNFGRQTLYDGIDASIV